MDMLSAYYPEIIAALALLLFYSWARRTSRRYSDGIKCELERNIQPAAPPTVHMAPPLVIPSDTASISDAKHNIRQKMMAGPKGMGQQLDLLVHELAVAQVNLEFIKLHQLLFRSQIRFLRAVNVAAGMAMSCQNAEAAYQKLTTADAEVAKTPFTKWIEFLAGEQLVNVGVYKFTLTLRGQDFLVWLVRNGFAEKENEFR